MKDRDHPRIEIACDRARSAARLRDGAAGPELEPLARSVREEFPTATVAPLVAGAGELPTVSLRAWRAPENDPQGLDAELGRRAVRGALRIAVVLDDVHAAPALREILTRAQPYLDRRNAASRSAVFDRALSAHRALHDLGKPLVRADYAHAVDVWQWTLRLDPDADLAVQLAALFHDVERLATEADVRVEQHAEHYAAFKRAHARAGAVMARRALAPVGPSADVLDRVEALVAEHETPGAERTLLNDADALSFFSLNSAGFVDYYGRDHARTKIGYTLGRMSAAAQSRLGSIRLRADVAALLEEVRASQARAGGTT